MKTEILKIMEMNKAGTISDEQMVELIEALKSEDAPRKDKEQKNDTGESFVDSLGGLFKTVSNSFKGLGIDMSEGTNSSTLSKVAIANKQNINDNSFNLSKANNFEVEDGSLIQDSSFNASNISNLLLRDQSEFTDNGVNASHLDSLLFVRSSMNDGNVNASKLKNISFENSKLSSMGLNACNFNNVKFENCEFSGVLFNKIKMNNVTIKNVKLSDFEKTNKNLSDCEINGQEEFRKV